MKNEKKQAPKDGNLTSPEFVPEVTPETVPEDTGNLSGGEYQQKKRGNA